MTAKTPGDVTVSFRVSVGNLHQPLPHPFTEVATTKNKRRSKLWLTSTKILIKPSPGFVKYFYIWLFFMFFVENVSEVFLSVEPKSCEPLSA